ncbi:MAG: NAD(P)H-binding protein [Bacteroidales bacterium]|nr:NAD(P)H-binding protein [Bacteroidales bacterium]
MNNRTVVVFGATGLVGSYLLEELVKNIKYSAIKVFTRKTLTIEHIKIIEHIVDIENIDSYKDEIRGNDLFICLGTTYRKAGSVKRVEEIDRDLPFAIGEMSLKKGIERIAVVSAVGANKKSRSYYNRIKGEMEQKIIDLGFTRTVIVRPSLLLGKREEFRLMESTGKLFMKLLSFVLTGRLKKYRAVHGRNVASAMIRALGESSDKIFYESDELKAL